MRISKTFVTVDAVIFKLIHDHLHLLLIQRKNDPFKNQWALPGGFVDENEDIDAAVRRELYEETHIKANDLKQLKAFGTPYRDPRGHVVSIAYYGFVDNNVEATADDDAKSVQWFSVDVLPEMAFDHLEIINFALTKT